MPVGIFMSLRAAKEGFFDCERVLRAVDAQTRRVLSRFGAYVRKTARWSIRTRKRGTYSRPGHPPYSHAGLLRRFILFAYDEMQQSVVIGPTLLPGRRAGRRPTVPELLEEGGMSPFVDRKGRNPRYAARPYMGPAYRKELPKVPSMWRDSIRTGRM